MEYRPVPEAHDEAFQRMLGYAFRPEDGPDFDFDEIPERPDNFSSRGLYDVPEGTPNADPKASDLRAVCGVYDLTVRVRGDWHRVGGVAAVASPPETRRRGHVSNLLGGVLREFRDEGVSISALWPFEYAFYRRFGWATAGEYAVTEVPPADLEGAVGETGDAAAKTGRFRRLTPDEYDALAAVHREWATEGLAVDRTEGWWRHRVFSGWRSDRYVYGWERDGDLRGYLVYTVEEEGDERVMAVWELAAVDSEARRQCLRFCRDHDSQVETVRLSGPVEARLFHTLDDPRAATVELHPGPMVRAVDVAAAVEALSFPEGVSGSVAVRVDDEFCPWNDGTFEVTVRDGGAACRPSGADPDVRVDVGALSQLLVGALSTAQLRTYGRLEVFDEKAGDLLTAACPPEPVYLREFF